MALKKLKGFILFERADDDDQIVPKKNNEIDLSI